MFIARSDKYERPTRVNDLYKVVRLKGGLLYVEELKFIDIGRGLITHYNKDGSSRSAALKPIS